MVVLGDERLGCKICKIRVCGYQMDCICLRVLRQASYCLAKNTGVRVGISLDRASDRRKFILFRSTLIQIFVEIVQLLIEMAVTGAGEATVLKVTQHLVLFATAIPHAYGCGH